MIFLIIFRNDGKNYRKEFKMCNTNEYENFKIETINNFTNGKILPCYKLIIDKPQASRKEIHVNNSSPEKWVTCQKRSINILN